MKRLILLLLLVFSACQMDSSIATTATSTVTAVPPAPSRQAYEEYTVDYLRARPYGGGTIEVMKLMEATNTFNRYLIRYPSDGLNIFGFVNVPRGTGPFPAIIMIHGFVDPATYTTLDYTTPLADRLTREGYVVFHPDLRNYPPSDQGDNLFRVGMSIDVLNLIALIKTKSGPSELFASAASENIGLLGHSMGGDIALRVLTVSSDVKATVLYASMSGDEVQNSQLLSGAFPDAVQVEQTVSADLVERISPMNYYQNITSPIQLHHGTADTTVPVSVAEETCTALKAARVQIECIYYPEEDHTFRSRVNEQFWGAMFDFFKKQLSP